MVIDPVEADARLSMLTDQRNSALNQVVLLAGTVAVQHAKIAELEAALKTPRDSREGIDSRDSED